MNSTATKSNPIHITPEQIRLRLAACLLSLLLILASFLYAPWSTDGPIFCPFRFLVGMPCPGCGLTRSFCALSQGNVSDAFMFHVFGPLLYAACVCAVPFLFVEVFRRRRFERIQQLLFSRRCALFAAWSLAIYHALRLLDMLVSGQVLPAIMRSALGTLLSNFGITVS